MCRYNEVLRDGREWRFRSAQDSVQRAHEQQAQRDGGDTSRAKLLMQQAVPVQQAVQAALLSDPHFAAGGPCGDPLVAGDTQNLHLHPAAGDAPTVAAASHHRHNHSDEPPLPVMPPAGGASPAVRPFEPGGAVVGGGLCEADRVQLVRRLQTLHTRRQSGDVTTGGGCGPSPLDGASEESALLMKELNAAVPSSAAV